MWERSGKIDRVVVDNGIHPMPHTYSNLVIHVVFSTKERIKFLTADRRAELFAYIVALVKEKGGQVIVINGVEDHVHILLAVPPNVLLSELMRFVKANSSRWFKERFKVPFAWQTGFGAFSVSRSGVEDVSRYIQKQEEHHRTRDFREEFLLLLKKNGVEFDERYLWR